MTTHADPNHSCSRPVSSMIWNAPTDTTSRISPMVSIRALTRVVSNGAIRVPTPKAHRATTGRLIKKIHGQLQLSMLVPPTHRPRIGEVGVILAQKARQLPAFTLGKQNG